MTEYTIKVCHDEEGIDVHILDLDPAKFEQEKPAILAALQKAVQVVERANTAQSFQ